MANSPYPLAVRVEALALLRSGASNAVVARKFGVPKGTVGAWKHYDRSRSGSLPERIAASCPRCNPDDTSVRAKPYSYLFGLYLGDGCISDGAAMRSKGVYALSIACGNTWPGLMDECEKAISAVMPSNKVNRVPKPGMHEVKSYSKHWPCLFPQHGPGRKHERAIILEPWQQQIVDEFPRKFIRGLIHTDALDKLGIEWRYNNRNCISVAKRASVAALDEFVGPKY